MRELGTLSSQEQAELFEDYLLTLNIKAVAEAEDGAWTIWIVNEDDLESARSELAKFQENPNADTYRKAVSAAHSLRKQALKEEEEARKRYVNVRDRWNQPMMKKAPLTMILIFVSVGVALISNFGKKVEPLVSTLGFAQFESGPRADGWYLPAGSRGDEQIRQGQVWRLVTPMFLHMNILHLLFNMYWTYQFGTMIESRRGTVRLLFIVLATSMAGNYLQFAMKNPYFGGMSGVNYGLFGYIWVKSRYAPELGLLIHPQLVALMLIFFFLCMTGLFGPVANWAHGGGLVAGMLIANAPLLYQEMKRK
ncbi:MAG: hypothetical protein Tsb009_08940 [Planctomycetaceae bacterium]